MLVEASSSLDNRLAQEPVTVSQHEPNWMYLNARTEYQAIKLPASAWLSVIERDGRINIDGSFDSNQREEICIDLNSSEE